MGGLAWRLRKTDTDDQLGTSLRGCVGSSPDSGRGRKDSGATYTADIFRASEETHPSAAASLRRSAADLRLLRLRRIQTG